ncbi:MAG: ribonuclease E/G [Alphaproteobacteria bacterium]|nr:ribonuclease E/G [Alphaproteobacteria bacterium]
MTRRTLFLDRSPGETRGVVMLDGLPERLILRREGDDPKLWQGARLAARVASLEPAMGAAFLDLGGARALLPFKPDARPSVGAFLEIEIRNEPRRGKLAVARVLGAAEGPPRLLAEAPDVEAQLLGFARDAEIVTGPAARRAADEAEAEVLEAVHPLPGGGSLAIEPTRALVAVDVDLGERKGGDSKRAARQANLAAITAAARLLRLKGLGGIVVLDLVGRGHDGTALLAAARAAFGADNPGVAIGPVGRFGTMEISIPRRSRPVAEILLDETGRFAAPSLAHRLLRRMAAEAEAQRGARIVGRCAPDVAEAAAPFIERLAGAFGARFRIVPDPSCPRDRVEAVRE